MKFSNVYICSLLLTFSFAARANPTLSITDSERHIELDSIVVDARALDAAVAEPGPSITVISAEDLAKASTVSEALAQVPGLQVIESGGPGQPTAVFVRGAPSEQTLVLMDGIEINDPSSTSRGFDFSNLTSAGIERIEVFRGPESLRFGPNASGGVINIVTRKGEGAHRTGYALEGGTYGTLNARLSATGASGRLGYSLTGAAQTTDGFSAASGPKEKLEQDGNRRYGLNARLNYETSDTAGATLTVRSLHNRTDLDYSGGSSGDDPNYVSDMRELSSGLSYHGRSLAGRLASSATITYMDLRRGYDNDPDPLHTDDYHETFESSSQGASTRHEYTFNRHHAIEALLQNKAETARSGQLFNGTPAAQDFRRQNLSGGGLIYKTAAGPLTLMAGGRFDRVQSHRALTYSVAPALRLGTATTLRASHSTGFRAPSLYQLHSSFGNSELRPEDTHSSEASIEHALAPSQSGETILSATVFRNTFKNLIDFDFAASKYGNISRASSAGAELQAQSPLTAQLSAKAAITWLTARDESTGARLPRRPARSWSAALDWKSGNWELSVNHLYTGARPDTDPETFTRTELPAHQTTGLQARRTLTRAARLTLKIQNLFNQNYSQAAGYQTSGIAIYTGLEGEI